MTARTSPSAGLLPQVAGILGQYITVMQNLAREVSLKRRPDSKDRKWWAEQARVVRANFAWLTAKRAARYPDWIRAALGPTAELWSLELVADVRAVRQCVSIHGNHVRSVDTDGLKPLMQRLRQSHRTLCEAIRQLYLADDIRDRAKKRPGRKPSRGIAHRNAEIVKMFRAEKTVNDVCHRFPDVSANNARRIKCDAKGRGEL